MAFLEGSTGFSPPFPPSFNASSFIIRDALQPVISTIRHFIHNYVIIHFLCGNAAILSRFLPFACQNARTFMTNQEGEHGSLCFARAMIPAIGSFWLFPTTAAEVFKRPEAYFNIFPATMADTRQTFHTMRHSLLMAAGFVEEPVGNATALVAIEWKISAGGLKRILKWTTAFFLRAGAAIWKSA